MATRREFLSNAALLSVGGLLTSAGASAIIGDVPHAKRMLA